METRAPYVIVGAFVLCAIAAVFGFVYWLNNTGGIGKRDTYQIVFNSPVPGLLVGAGVLFNGIRVGEVTSLSIAADRPREVHASIAVAQNTPVRADTKVGLDFQGLTGVPVVALEGGESISAAPVNGALIAEPGAGQSMTQAARDALRKVDKVLSDNSQPLHEAITNLSTFTEGLARNTPKLDGIVAGLEKMTGATTPPRKIVYDLRAIDKFPASKTPLVAGLAIAEPTATARLQTQRFLFASDEEQHEAFENAQWSDSLPALIQARLLQSFENYDIAHAPIRADSINPAETRLVIDLRQFEIGVDPGKATIALSAKIINGAGQVKTARLFEASAPLDGLTPAAAVAGFNRAFDELGRSLILWVASVR
ncbi:MAG TPA: ABC-type transport auxiliary lipoprotein family protein [Bradyrhizobium sp.]|uniref:ABC-type transport auxiliary lipoprotein family protein n=1 Tax=Bradyrhizobium sp. TaxID=376 RepID=UPI002D7EFF6C|nr:ABC-type transport auxiliary lipoprotein family protein [Bradyrhizobium sp.]HET7884826.1 ABC-type transport auxiliary lipoprotein family protein [Bradyrhizobium sp.]